MTTQHQAPEVTSEDREAAADLYQTVHAPDENPQDIRIADSIRKGNNDHWSWVKAFAAHRTRATQPLSLTVDEEMVIARLRELLAKATPLPWVRAVICNIVTKEYHNGMNMQTNLSFKPVDPDLITEAVNALPALLDRLQSLSLPVDIDRSGLAQEVE